MTRLACGLSTLAVFVSLSAPTLAQTSTTASAPGLPRAVIVDAGGRRIGSLAGPNRILYDFPDGSAIVTANAIGLVAFPTDDPAGYPNQYYYESADCSGQAYGAPAQVPELGAVSLRVGEPAAGVTLAGQLLYVTRERVSKTPQSWLDRSIAGALCNDGLGPLPSAVYSTIRSSALPSYRLPLSIAVADAPSPPSITNPGRAKPTGVGVYDADGNYVGNILDQDVVWLKFDDGEAALRTNPIGRFVDNWAQETTYYFETADCSGAAYFQANALPSRGVYRAAETAGAGGSVWYPKKPFEIIVARSSKRVAGACNPVASKNFAAGKVGQARLAAFNPPMTIK